MSLVTRRGWSFRHRLGKRLIWKVGPSKTASAKLKDQQIALTGLVDAIREYRRLAETAPLTLQGQKYTEAVEELNKAIDRAEAPCSN
jgi:hypothetical protein